MKPIHVSQKDLATWLAIGARHVRELTTMGVLTQTASGYDLKASVHAYLNLIKSRVGTVTDERTRLLKAQADMGKLKVRQRTGELVLRATVAKQTFDAVRQARDRMQNIPDRVAGICAAEPDQRTIHTMLTKEIHQSLEDLSS